MVLENRLPLSSKEKLVRLFTSRLYRHQLSMLDLFPRSTLETTDIKYRLGSSVND